MSLSGELERLNKLHQEGTLNDQEFAQAKNKLLNQPAGSEPPQRGSSPGDAGDRDSSLALVLAILGLVVILVFFFGVMLAHHRHSGFWFRWGR